MISTTFSFFFFFSAFWFLFSAFFCFFFQPFFSLFSFCFFCFFCFFTIRCERDLGTQEAGSEYGYAKKRERESERAREREGEREGERAGEREGERGSARESKRENLKPKKAHQTRRKFIERQNHCRHTQYHEKKHIFSCHISILCDFPSFPSPFSFFNGKNEWKK